MRALSPRAYGLRLGACAAVLVAMIIASPGIGSERSSFGWWDVWRARLGIDIPANEIARKPLADIDGDGAISQTERSAYAAQARAVGFDLRLPRTLLALQVGITLALCGATFQILFRNPLATPYTLGIASGGSLGALIAIRAGWGVVVLGVSALTLSAFVGALAVVAAVFMVARGSRRLTSNEMLLAGVTLGLFCSAMMMLVTSMSNERVTFATVRWMMGTLDGFSTLQSFAVLPLVLPAWVVLTGLSRAMNQYRLGDELAESRGVGVRRLQGACVLVATLAVAGVVARCGPIGFVGLVVPHIAMLVFGSDCRILLPASALTGGIFLILCDWVSQVAMRLAGYVTGRQLESAILPIGVVTAIVGVPIFLVLLRRKRRRGA